MEKYINTNFGCAPTLCELLRALKLPEDDDSVIGEIAEDLLGDASAIACPKSVYAFSPVILDCDTVTINGITFDNAFVAQTLCHEPAVVIYVATCGTELECWSSSLTDPLELYIADTLKLLYLSKARAALVEIVKERYFPDAMHLPSLNPGSLKEWPIYGQRDLFSALGDVTQDIGVRLTDNMLMLPTKSISGIFFKSETPYENCSLCPNLDCPGRRAPYMSDM